MKLKLTILLLSFSFLSINASAANNNLCDGWGDMGFCFTINYPTVYAIDSNNRRVEANISPLDMTHFCVDYASQDLAVDAKVGPIQSGLKFARYSRGDWRVVSSAGNTAISTLACLKFKPR